MKKITLISALFIFVMLMLAGCGQTEQASVQIQYEGKTYQSGFYGDMELQQDLSGYVTEEFELDGITYQVLTLDEHDWICTKDAPQTVFCSAETFEAEKALYSDPEQIYYTVSFGDSKNPIDKIHVTGMDDSQYEDLMKFVQKHKYDPQHPDKDKGQLQCPMPDATESKIHFYQESNDEIFSRGSSTTYFSINNQVVLYYCADEEHSTEEQKYCYVVLAPDELSELIANLVNILSAMG